MFHKESNSLGQMKAQSLIMVSAVVLIKPALERVTSVKMIKNQKIIITKFPQWPLKRFLPQN